MFNYTDIDIDLFSVHNFSTMVDISSTQFQAAIDCARTQWLKTLLSEVLPQLLPLTHSKRDLEKAKSFDTLIKEKFIERGLISPSQQKNRITDVRNAIKVFDPHHPALDFVGLSSEEWISINSRAASVTHNRSTQFLTNPAKIAQTAFELLYSERWSDLAAALTVVTGRRVSEVLKTASFELASNFSVLFVGAAKRRNESIPLQFEIPTLVEAPLVLNALSRLRSLLDTQGLTNRQINDQYEQAVARACDLHFRDLVPTRDGKTNLYSHLFRSVYATIASHWFCPPNVSDLEFRAYIQGHFKVLDEHNKTKQTDMASSRHYWDYKISDGHGNVDGRLGIRLHEDGVSVLNAFAPKTSSPQPLGRLVKINVREHDRSDLAAIQEQFNLPTRAHAHHFVLSLAQALIRKASELDISPESLIEGLDSSSPISTPDSSTTIPDSAASSHSSPMNNQDEIMTQSDSSVPPTQLLLEKMDKQFDQMGLLTNAIHELVNTLSSQASVSPPFNQSADVQPHQVKQKSKSQKPKPTSEPSARQLHSTHVRQTINQYIDAIMAFNDTLDLPHQDKWAISVAGLKRLAGCGQHPIYAVFKQRQSEIDAHHSKHQLSPTHNKKPLSSLSIESVISL